MISSSLKFQVNHMSYAAYLAELGKELDRTKNIVKAQYDFAVNGGAIGAISLTEKIPDNAIITRAWVEVLTTLTSATDAATVALHLQSADDVVAAIAISDVSNPWDAGFQACIQDNTLAHFLKLTAERTLTATIAVEALTAGKFNLYVEYVLSD